MSATTTEVIVAAPRVRAKAAARVAGVGGVAVGVAGAADAAAADRVLAACHPVPDQATDIERIAQQPVITGGAAADDCVKPDAAGRTGDPLQVQRAGDGPRRFAGEVVSEDPAHDGGLVWGDLTQAAIRLAIVL